VTTLRVGRTSDRCEVLGPGVRAVIWVTGCHLRCRECMTPEFLDFGAGGDVPLSELRAWIAGLTDIAGLTISGGEPFEQAAELSELLALISRDRSELTTMAFTGYALSDLRSGTPAQRRLLERLDIVVDGPYLPERHSSHRWLGSGNQRVHWLTGRGLVAGQELRRSAGVEVTVEADGSFAVSGVPPTRGFRRRLRSRLRANGVMGTTRESL
jgi:anaerobic ribonucleoside-triphosphate reductase activating protein